MMKNAHGRRRKQWAMAHLVWRGLLGIGVMMIVSACQVGRSPRSLYTAASPATFGDREALSVALQGLGAGVSPREAHALAEQALHEVELARQQYQVKGSALVRNVAINLGWADWGLCWQWTEWLGAPLVHGSFQSFQVHWGCAHRGSKWLEHNAVVITARDQPFSSGLVLDPWRKSGRLTWVPVADDRFPWKHDFPAEVRWKR